MSTSAEHIHPLLVLTLIFSIVNARIMESGTEA
jgi:hypothetical protein